MFNVQYPRKIHRHARIGDVESVEWLPTDNKNSLLFLFSLITLSLILPFTKQVAIFLSTTQPTLSC